MGRVIRQTAIRQTIGTASLAGLGLAGAFLLAGCGMAAAPQPPSLHLPRQVKDLKAERSGNTVELSWDSPKQTTDRLKLTAPVRFRICRQQGNSPCQTVATTTGLPDQPASYTDRLSAALATGPLRAATYRVYGLNKNDRSAGPSNAAPVLLGAAPPAIAGLTANMTERGVVLRWQKLPDLPAGTQIQLHRTLVLPPDATKKNSSSQLTAEPVEQTLAVATHATGNEQGIALDTGVQFGRTYRYRATRVVTQQVNKQALHAASTDSNAVTIVTRDTFPPAAPVGLVAVPVSAAINGGRPEVDLSWSPNTETDLAQYRVYRREVGAQPGQANQLPQRIAPENESEPLAAPAFRDVHVEPGRTYAYTVTAVDSSDNESAHSAEVQVAVPGT